MKKIKFILALSIFVLLIAISPVLAMDNDTSVLSENSTVIQTDYYVDANYINDDGNGSIVNPYNELNLNKIDDNSIIHIANGVYSLNEGKTYSNLTIMGQDPEKTIVNFYDAPGFSSEGLITLKNLTLIGLRINLYNNSNLTAINTIFSSSSSSYSTISSYPYSEPDGGNTVVLDNCSFKDNFAKYGGAINLVRSTLNITNSIFSNNQASYWGGAIACDDVEVFMSNTKFINNSAVDESGGAIFLKNSTFMAEYLDLINCSSCFGGAITSLSGDLNLTNCLAKNNWAKYYGGAIFKMYTSFELFNSIFENNSALSGGALYVADIDDFKISSNYFVNNNASVTGGAIYSIFSDAYYDIEDSVLNNTFEDNTANVYSDVYQNSLIYLIHDGNYTFIHNNNSYDDSLPEIFDLRDFGYVTPVRNQGNGGNCWSFAASAALESAILKATGISYDLSEENIKNIASRYSEYGWAMETNVGGYDRMAVGYLTSWLGPINETCDEYNPKSLLSSLFNASVHVQNIVFLTRNNYTDNDAIKKAIMNYGAVSTSTYWLSSFLKNNKNYYYTGNLGANHAVAIIGWDDNYDASNFKTSPPGNGAWIIKNSWGTSAGDKGFYYVSYYDTKFCLPGKYVSYAFVLNDSIKYDKNYQYDIPGRTDYFFNESATVWYKNKFTATDDEYLAAVSTYFEKDTNWDLFIYVNNSLKLTQSGFANPSYKTIDLDSFIPLKVGDIFEIVFKITVSKEAGVPVSESVSLNSEFYGEGISFISYDGKNWKDFYDLEWTYPDHNYYSQVACIKAFTVLNAIDSIINLSANYIDDNHLDIIVTVYDEYGNLVKNGDVTYAIGNIQKTLTLVNGIAKISNITICDGINKINVCFSSVGYVDSINQICVSNSVINTSISLNVLSQENPSQLQAIITDQYNNPVESGKVTFNFDGTEHVVNVYNGIANFNHTFKTSGLKKVYAYYSDLYCYNSSYVNESILITFKGTVISLSVNTQFNPIIITAEVRDVDGNPVNQGVVTFDVEGVKYTVNVNEGIASLTHTFKNIGSQPINLYYIDENYVYGESYYTESIIVSLKSTSVSLNVKSNDKVNNPVEIVATIVDDEGNLVKTGKVTFYLDGLTKVVQVENGEASLIHIFKNIGLNDIIVKYEDSYYYESTNKSISLEVSKINVDLSLNVEKNLRDVNISLNLSKNIDEYISLYINDEYYPVKSNNGKFSINFNNLPNGEYVVKAHINSYIYDSINQSINFKINHFNTNILSNDAIFYVSDTIYYSVVLKDETNIPISNYKVSLNIANNVINGVTDSSGKVLFRLSVSAGTYNVKINFEGDDYYLKNNSSNIISIKSTVSLPTNTKYTFNAEYSLKLLDSQGNPLKNKHVNITINDEQKTISTDSNGKVIYPIDVNPGSYIITVTNPVTKEIKSQTIKVVARLNGNNAVTMYYGSGSVYKVRAYDDYGNAAAGVNVKFTINGKTYTRQTNQNGYASFKITQQAGTYTITATYKNFKVSNKVVVKPTLVLSAKTVKKSKTFTYKVKLLNNKGKILKYKKVTVKFKGKTYTAKTNSKGIATFKIKSYTKTGKFTLTASYGSAKVSKTITVKK